MIENQFLLKSDYKEFEIFPWIFNVREKQISINLPSIVKESTEDSGDFVSIDRLLDVIYPEDISKIALEKISSLTIAEPDFSLDIRIKTDGKFRWYEFRGTVTKRILDGTPTMLKGVAFSIEKRKEKEFQKEKERESAVDISNKNNDFWSTIIQEIRSPLHSIVGFSELLVNQTNQEEREKYLEIIKRNNEILMSLIDGVLDLSDGVDQQDILNEEKISLWEFLVEIQQVYSMKIKGPVRLLFTNTYDSLKIIIDKEKLNQILGNILEHSIKYTQAGYISYGYEIIDDKLRFVINDTGTSTPSAQLINLFSSKDKTDANDSSLLMGLRMCKSLVRKMNGEINVNSSEGAGSSFIIDFPLNLADVKQEPTKMEEEEEQAVAEIKHDLPTILVAEDVVYNYMMMKTLLEGRFNVVHAENGQKAVEVFENENVDFIFMDIKMPVMDGLEATRIIRQKSDSVPIIILTAYAVRSLKKEASEAGCTDILTKPASAKQINATIRKFMK
ncbi:MAG: response regulator [Bacteroidales bacterium]|nr:response regulator [Bacteroidales bacterium]